MNSFSWMMNMCAFFAEAYRYVCEDVPNILHNNINWQLNVCLKIRRKIFGAPHFISSNFFHRCHKFRQISTMNEAPKLKTGISVDFVVISLKTNHTVRFYEIYKKSCSFFHSKVFIKIFQYYWRKLQICKILMIWIVFKGHLYQ